MKQPENHYPQLCNQFYSSLISEISNVQTFKGKWSLIKSKLQQLPALLSDLSDFPSLSSNPLSADLLKALSQTLSDALSLAILCESPNPPIGKLHTQSNLDSITTQLDQHIRDADVLIKSGVLRETHLCPGPPRESERIEARNLITRLQIGNSESKNSAMDSLLILLHEDDKNVLVAVAEGAVPVIVKLLDSSCVEIKEKAVSAIARVSVLESSKHVLVAEGILLLNHLLRVIESGTGPAKEKACIALQALSFSKDNAHAIGCRSGISSLLEICIAGTPGSQAVAAGILRNLAGFPDIIPNFVEENAVPVLIGLAASGTQMAQENAIGCLSNLVSEEDESLKMMVVREDCIECLKNFWDGASWTRNHEVAVALLRNLVSGKSIVELLITAGFIPRLVRVLNCGISTVRTTAARAVYEMAFTMKTRKKMGEAGCIPPLVRMFEAKVVEEKEAAVKAVSLLLSYIGNRKIFRKQEKGIETVVQLLDPSIQNLDKKHVMAILLSVSYCKKCKKRIVASGACRYLEKLAEMEKEGAKRLLENLCRGKLWGVFKRT
ncbi:U-box domain-containing protein 10-like isoform X1 [Aristolochia californica]|uniref:U-box domain-containing protein 10-like isoform X1 n=1 Tax=Aristolochia californica TaxID=171875 RepID=UPI0035E3A433